MKIEELKQILIANGVVGAGGAGFPTYGKITTKVETILVNCAECEPLLKVHRQVLEKYALEIVKTLSLLQTTMRAKEVKVCLKASYKETVEALKDVIDSFPKISIHYLQEAYPVGDEVVLIYEATKKIVAPGSLPITQGVVVFNVETILNTYEAVYNQKPVTHKYLTITGEVKCPTTLKLPLGMKVKDAVELAGGKTIEDVAYVMGGPMTGTMVGEYDVITKTTNGILVLPSNHYVVKKKTKNTSLDMKKAMASCCQCELCTSLCPRNLLGHPIEPHAFMRSATSGTTADVEPFLNTMFCVSCGLCEMYSCMQELSPRTLMDEYKKKLIQKGIKKPENVKEVQVNPFREYRSVPVKRLLARLDLEQYNVKAPLEEVQVWESDAVKIPLKQHIGVSAIACVKTDDVVVEGQVIGEEQKGVFSLPVHASMSGVIVDVNEQYIRIAKK